MATQIKVVIAVHPQDCLAMAGTDKKPSRVTERAVQVGGRIRQLREAFGWTQGQLARHIGVTENAVTQYETGRAMPRPQRLQQVAEAFETSVEWLMTGGDEVELFRAQTTAEADMLREFRKIPLEQQGFALAAVQGMASRTGKK
jgi:transcriptional regulator with XRE-family HTH domain